MADDFFEDTLDATGFLTDQVYWFLVVFVLYREILFHPLEPLPAWASFLVLGGMALICALLNVWIPRFKQNGLSEFCNLAISYGVYTLLTYLPVYGYASIMWTILGSAICMAVLYSVVLLALRIGNKDPAIRSRVVRRRIWRAVLIGRGILSVGCAVLVIVVGVAAYRGYPARVSVESAADSSEQTAGYMDTLLFFQEDEWKGLSLQQKLDALQALTDIESSYLGLPEKITVQATSMFDGTKSYYSDEDLLIALNIEDVIHAPAEEVMDSLLHEVYHSYENRLVDLYEILDVESRKLRLFRDAKAYREEFESYTSGEEDYAEYYNQTCEIDARLYAAISVEDYYDQIAEYLQEKNDTEGDTASQAAEIETGE